MKLKILILIVSFLYILKHVNNILNNYTFEKSVEVKSSEKCSRFENLEEVGTFESEYTSNHARTNFG